MSDHDKAAEAAVVEHEPDPMGTGHDAAASAEAEGGPYQESALQSNLKLWSCITAFLAAMVLVAFFIVGRGDPAALPKPPESTAAKVAREKREADEKARVEARYAWAMAKGKSSFARQEYDEAASAYKLALESKPGDSAAQGGLTASTEAAQSKAQEDARLADQRAREEKAEKEAAARKREDDLRKQGEILERLAQPLRTVPRSAPVTESVEETVILTATGPKKVSKVTYSDTGPQKTLTVRLKPAEVWPLDPLWIKGPHNVEQPDGWGTSDRVQYQAYFQEGEVGAAVDLVFEYPTTGGSTDPVRHVLGTDVNFGERSGIFQIKNVSTQEAVYTITWHRVPAPPPAASGK